MKAFIIKMRAKQDNKEITSLEERYNVPEIIIEDPARASVNHFKILCDFGYYLCMTPFKFEVHESKVSENAIDISLKSSFMSIALVRIFLLLSIVGHCWGSLIKIYSQPEDVIIYFNVAHLGIHLSMMILFYRNLFANSDNCFKIMMEVAHCSFLKFGEETANSNQTKVKFLIKKLTVIKNFI